MDHASNQTVNLTSTAVNAKLTSLSVFNVKPTLTELSNSQNTFVSAPMDSSKEPTEHASHAAKDVQNVHQHQNARTVSLKPPTTTTVPANALQEHSSKYLQMV